MSFVAVAIGGAGLLGAGASIYGSNKQSDSANQAANLQLGMFNTAQSKSQPFVDFGQGQLPTLNKLLTPGADQTATLAQLPGFQFAQTQGEKSITNQKTVSGLGGNVLRAASDYATGNAQQFSSQYINQLLQAAGLGQSAAAGVGNQAIQTGANAGGSIIGAGNAQAAGAVGASNALGGAANSWANYNLINRLTGSPSGAWGGGSTPSVTSDLGAGTGGAPFLTY